VIGKLKPNRNGNAKRSAEQLKKDEEASKQAAALLSITKTDTTTPSKEQLQVAGFVFNQTRALNAVFADLPDRPERGRPGDAPGTPMRPFAGCDGTLWSELQNNKAKKPAFVPAVTLNYDGEPVPDGLPEAKEEKLNADQQREFDALTPLIDSYAAKNLADMYHTEAPALIEPVWKLISGGPGTGAFVCGTVSDGVSVFGPRVSKRVRGKGLRSTATVVCPSPKPPVLSKH